MAAVGPAPERGLLGGAGAPEAATAALAIGRNPWEGGHLREVISVARSSDGSAPQEGATTG